jgi:hypothetical protein
MRTLLVAHTPGAVDNPRARKSVAALKRALSHRLAALAAVGLLCALVVLSVADLTTGASGSQTSGVPPQSAAAPPQAPGNTSPGATGTKTDPAAATFSTEQGLLLVSVKPDKVADYEAVIVALQDALSGATDEEARTLAAGWRVYKAADLDAKANAIFVHVLQPVVAGVDYRPSLWLDKLLEGAPADLLAKYRDSIAAGPTKLPLVEFANMSVKPTPKPTNESPDAPPPPQKPSNGSPAGPQ